MTGEARGTDQTLDDPTWSSTTWDSIVAAYADASVKSACLRLQDEFGVDIVVLLTCAVAARTGTLIDEDTYQEAWNTTSDLRRDLVQPLRELRRSIGPLGHGAEDRNLSHALMRAELTAERLLLDRLEPILNRPDRNAASTKDSLLKVVQGCFRFHTPGGRVDGSATPTDFFDLALKVVVESD